MLTLRCAVGQGLASEAEKSKRCDDGHISTTKGGNDSRLGMLIELDPENVLGVSELSYGRRMVRKLQNPPKSPPEVAFWPGFLPICTPLQCHILNKSEMV